MTGAEAFWDRVSASSAAWAQAQQLKQSLELQGICAQNGGPEATAARAAAGDFRAGLEEFLAILTRDKNFQDQAARKAMLTVFGLVGERSDLAEEYRKRLALVLF